MDDLLVAPREMSDQAVFDESVRRLLGQGGPGWDVGLGGCRYEAEDGKRCAVGVLLRREHLASGMRGTQTVWQLPEVVSDWLGVRNADRGALLNAMQAAHDDAAEAAMLEGGDWVRELRVGMRYVARWYGLSAAVLG